jgi:HK97 family phage major capsid protein
VITVNATVNLANVTVDLGKLWLALRGANVRMANCGWLMAPRTENYLRNLRDGNGNKAFPEMEGMTTPRLQGYPVASTTQIPTNLAVTGSNESEIYFVDFNDAIIAEVPGMIIDASGEAAYHDGSNVVAAFSLDQTVIRVIAQHDFGMRYDASVAVLSDVDWV